jgi:CRP-like cAMP-binding protein
MPHPTQSFVRNCLLSEVDPAGYAAIGPHLEPVDFPKGTVLIEAGMPFTHAHFLNSGLGSIVVSTADSRRVEAGIFGREGLSGFDCLLGADQCPQTTLVQVEGEGYRVSIDALRTACEQSALLRDILLRYVHVFISQTSYTALSNATQSVEGRLARWLLMCHDRVTGDDMVLTHEFLSIMLAVQRPSVTTALHMIEGYGFIKACRGHITIKDRDALIDFADGMYGVPEAEYRRLIGPFG